MQNLNNNKKKLWSWFLVSIACVCWRYGVWDATEAIAPSARDYMNSLYEIYWSDSVDAIGARSNGTCGTKESMPRIHIDKSTHIHVET